MYSIPVLKSTVPLSRTIKDFWIFHSKKKKYQKMGAIAQTLAVPNDISNQ